MLDRRTCLSLCVVFVLCAGVLRAAAQPTPFSQLHPPAQQDRIAAAPDLSRVMPLTAALPAWATPANQLSQAVDYAQPLHLTFVLRRDPAVEAAFDQLLADQQSLASPLYHQWLTPQQIGALYGPTQHDLAAVIAWATAQGLTLTAVQPNHILLDFDTTLATAATAFHTSFAQFRVGNATRLAPTASPMLPQALAPVLAGIGGLVETHFEPQSHVSFQTVPAQTLPAPAATSEAHPLATFSSGSAHYLSPSDFDTIYDLTSVQSGGNTGATIGSTPQRIAVIGRSRVTSSDITTFESVMGLPSKLPNVVLAGTDPGIGNDADEQTLDVQRVIGTAPGAQVDLVIAATSGNNDGVNIAMAYNINTLRDPVMSVSYGSCEANDGANVTANLNAMFQTAAAEGITTLVSSGDSGAAACDTSFTHAPSSQVLSVSALCASPYVTCVGGTQFNDTASPSTYWNSTNGAGYSSALSYIPEGAWNEPTSSQGNVVAGTGGGASVYIAKPGWQTGTGVPADGRRDVPDVSFSAAGHDGYLGCYTSNGATATCTASSQGFAVAIFEGTSAAAPGMAGIVALLNTRTGSAQGNINPLLYSLAASTPAAFHDATPTTSGVGAACTTSTPSMCNNSTPATSSLNGGLAGYALTAGYDQATGLGSLDVSKLLSAATSTSVAATTLTLAQPTPNPATVGQSVALQATLTPASSTSTPTGTVQFYATLNPVTANPTNPIGTATLSSKIASLSYTFAAAGTYTITAAYSGDTNFAMSSAQGVSVTVNSPAFTVTPAVTALSLISGATTGNTVAINLASTNNFSGAVALGCTVTNAAGTAAGSCALTPASATLAAGGTAQSTLAVSSTPGTAGVLNVVVSGVNGSTTVTAPAIAVKLTAASFALAATPAATTAASGTTATSTVTLTSVNGFAGTVALNCTGSLVNGTTTTTSACSVAPASVTLASGGTATAAVSIPTSGGGSLTATISGTGTTSGATLASTASTQVTVAVTAPGLALAASPTTLSFTSGATASNSSTVTLTSLNGFTGAVALNCTLSTGTAGYPPSCVVTPQTVTLAANGTATAVLTISSTTAHAASGGAQAALSRIAALLALLLFLPLSRRRRLRSLAMVAVVCTALGLLSGCSSSATTPAHTLQSSAGTYTATITASGASAGSSTTVSTTSTVAVIIN